MSQKSSSKKCELFAEEAFSNHIVSDILHSRQKHNSVCEQDFKSYCSENEQTHSSSSWGFDDFEVKSVNKIASSLHAVDDILYEEVHDKIFSHELYLECQKWAKSFPHLRVKGKQMLITNSDTENTFGDFVNLTRRKYTDVSDCKHEKTNNAFFTEVVIAEDGNYNKGEQVSQRLNECMETMDSRECVSNNFNVTYVEDKIIERLSAHLWRDIIFYLKKTRSIESPDYVQHDFLPPIIGKELSLTRPKAMIKNLLKTDFPKLDGILTVSPKILLPRPSKRHSLSKTGTKHISAVDSVDSKSSMVGSVSKFYAQTSGLPVQAKISEIRKTTGQVLDVVPLYLPLAEDCNLIDNNFLQVKRIELGNKELRNKFSTFESHAFSDKPPSFLPPIDDINHSPSFVVKDMIYSIADEARVQSGCISNQHSKYTRHLSQRNSRPSTSKMPLDMIHSKVEDSVNIPICNGTTTDENRQNSDNLLPVVTSSELTEKRRNKF